MISRSAAFRVARAPSPFLQPGMRYVHYVRSFVCACAVVVAAVTRRRAVATSHVLTASTGVLRRSAHRVTVNAAGYSAPVKASNLSPGHMITVEVVGETTVTEVPAAGSYRIYGACMCTVCGMPHFERVAAVARHAVCHYGCCGDASLCCCCIGAGAAGTVAPSLTLCCVFDPAFIDLMRSPERQEHGCWRPR